MSETSRPTSNVIVNSPFDVPQRHWLPQRDGTLQLVESRRAASYEIYDVRNNTRGWRRWTRSTRFASAWRSGGATTIPASPPSRGNEFSTCPSESMRQKLNQAEVLVENWHKLMPATEQERSVVKKGRQTDEVFAREVLGRLAEARDIVVINDEAHHAYRKPADVKISKADAERLGLDLDEATRCLPPCVTTCSGRPST